MSRQDVQAIAEQVFGHTAVVRKEGFMWRCYLAERFMLEAVTKARLARKMELL